MVTPTTRVCSGGSPGNRSAGNRKMSTMRLSKTWSWLILSLFFRGGIVSEVAAQSSSESDPIVPPPPTMAPITPMPTDLGWRGCESMETPAGETVPVEIGKGTLVCFHVGGSETRSWSDGVDYLRYVFQPKADEFSRYHIPKSYKNLIEVEPSSDFRGHKTIGAASQSQISFLRGFFDHDERRIFPYLLIIIDVRDGIVQGITWDEACLFCGAGRCEENTYDYNGQLRTRSEIGQYTKGCYFTKDECDAEPEESEKCDITISVVWTGTDKNGQSFQSAASRYSLFPVQSVTDQISQFTSFF